MIKVITQDEAEQAIFYIANLLSHLEDKCPEWYSSSDEVLQADDFVKQFED